MATLLLQTSKGCGNIYYHLYFLQRSSKDSEKYLCAERGKEKRNYSCLICLFHKLDTSHCHDIFIFLDTWLASNLICAGVSMGGSPSFSPIFILGSNSRNQAPPNPWSLILVHLLHVTVAVKKILENCQSPLRDKILINKNNLKLSLFIGKRGHWHYSVKKPIFYKHMVFLGEIKAKSVQSLLPSELTTPFNKTKSSQCWEELFP